MLGNVATCISYPLRRNLNQMTRKASPCKHWCCWISGRLQFLCLLQPHCWSYKNFLPTPSTLCTEAAGPPSTTDKMLLKLSFKWKKEVGEKNVGFINQRQGIICMPPGWCHNNNALRYSSDLFHKHIYTRVCSIHTADQEWTPEVAREADTSIIYHTWWLPSLQHFHTGVSSCHLFACKLPMKPHTSPHLQGQVQIQY